MVVTDAEYQTMFIELTGSTADIIPTSLSQSFMGYQALDLTHGSPVVNTLPFGPGIIDVQPMNPNPYRANEPQPVAESPEEELAQEESIWGRVKNILGFKRNDLVDTNEVTAKEVAPATGTPNNTLAAEQTFHAVAPGQEFNNYDLRPLKLMHHINPTSYDPSVQARLSNGTMIPVDYSGRTPCCKTPAENQHNFPFQVSGMNVPFKDMPSMPPSPLGGDHPVISSAFSYDGRLGQQISPAENSSYYGVDSMTGIGSTKTLVEWSQGYSLLKISDDSIRGIPSGPGMGKGEIILYRR
jgi:hypothetical protein